MSPEDQKTVGQIVSAAHEKLRNLGHHPAPLDRAIVGVVLYIAKQALPKRQYVPWLRQHTGLSQKAGARYIASMHKYLSTRHEEAEVDRAMKELLLPGVKW